MTCLTFVFEKCSTVPKVSATGHYRSTSRRPRRNQSPRASHATNPVKRPVWALLYRVSSKGFFLDLHPRGEDDDDDERRSLFTLHAMTLARFVDSGVYRVPQDLVITSYMTFTLLVFQVFKCTVITITRNKFRCSIFTLILL